MTYYYYYNTYTKNWIFRLELLHIPAISQQSFFIPYYKTVKIYFDDWKLYSTVLLFFLSIVFGVGVKLFVYFGTDDRFKCRFRNTIPLKLWYSLQGSFPCQTVLWWTFRVYVTMKISRLPTLKFILEHIKKKKNMFSS